MHYRSHDRRRGRDDSTARSARWAWQVFRAQAACPLLPSRLRRVRAANGCLALRQLGAWFQCHDSLAERSKALAQGASPKGCGLEPHSFQFEVKLHAQMARSHALAQSSDVADRLARRVGTREEASEGLAASQRTNGKEGRDAVRRICPRSARRNGVARNPEMHNTKHVSPKRVTQLQRQIHGAKRRSQAKPSAQSCRACAYLPRSITIGPKAAGDMTPPADAGGVFQRAARRGSSRARRGRGA